MASRRSVSASVIITARPLFMSLAPEPKQRSPSMRAGPFSVRTVSRWPTSAMRGPRPRVTGTTIESP